MPSNFGLQVKNCKNQLAFGKRVLQQYNIDIAIVVLRSKEAVKFHLYCTLRNRRCVLGLISSFKSDGADTPLLSLLRRL